jgi:hypothetical protein
MVDLIIFKGRQLWKIRYNKAEQYALNRAYINYIEDICLVMIDRSIDR